MVGSWQWWRLVSFLPTTNSQLPTSSERDVVFLELLVFAERRLRGRLWARLGALGRGPALRAAVGGRATLLVATATAASTAVTTAASATTAVPAAAVLAHVGVVEASPAAATPAAVSVAAADELEVVDDDGELGALAAALLVFPGVVLDAALYEDGLALGEVLVDDLAGAAEGGAVDEQDLFAVLALLGLELTVTGQPELGDRPQGDRPPRREEEAGANKD